jgi:thioredoxin reductase (NADPH)
MTDAPYDRRAEVGIVGAGPIGLELAVALKRIGVDYVHFDAHQIGHTIAWWPRDTEFFSSSERVAIAGVPIQTLRQQRITGEEYLAYLRAVVEQYDLEVRTYEPVVEVTRLEEGFSVRTETQTGDRRYWCRFVVLAKGDMDRPNALGIPGEDLPHVSHYFRRAHEYFRKRLLVVGGRNSAMEAALRCWRGGAQVSMSYRREAFDADAVKKYHLADLRNQIKKGTIEFLPATVPVEIRPGEVDLAPTTDGLPDRERVRVHQVDFVLMCTGFHQDMRLYEIAGVELSGSDRVPVYDPETMETNVPGLYLVGTTAAGNQGRYALFIENTHKHVLKVVCAITGRRDTRIGTIPSRTYELLLSEIWSN